VTSRLFTSESVTEGHPDKICDAISDTILDELLRQDPNSRVAVETMVTTGQVHVAGEVTTGAQSPDIARGVDTAYETRTHEAEESRGTDDATISLQGAGDQGLMFGYACTDTPELMPLPIALAHRLARGLATVRKSGAVPYLRPDGKTQVTIEYLGDRPVRLDTVVVSSQHAENIHLEQLLAVDVKEQVVEPELASLDIDVSGYRLLVNPTGRFVIGGPMGDAGLTGRKIIVDTYGGMARHGGGAFSGKDPSKVDRSAAYAMRWVAKNAVAAGLADRIEVQVAYAIGKASPVGLFVETFGTEQVDPSKIADAIRQVFDLRPAAIIRDLDLKRPIYAQTAAYGHFGRTDVDLPWENTDRASDLKSVLGI